MIGLLQPEPRPLNALPAQRTGGDRVEYDEGFDCFDGPFGGETGLTQLSQSRYVGNALRIQLESLSIHEHRFPQAVQLRAARNSRGAAVCYIDSPSMRTTENGQEWRPNDVLIAVSDRLDIVTRGPSTFVWIEFPCFDADASDPTYVFASQTIRRLAIDDEGRTLFSVDSDRLDRVRGSVTEKLRLLRGGRQTFGKALFSKEDEWELRQMLDSLITTASVRQPDARHAGDYAFARRVEAFMLEHIDEPLTLGQIARSVDCSAGTLINIFKRTVGLSPMAYWRIVRLNEARRRIERAVIPQPRIIDIAVDCGFWHLGHFGTAYKTMFGKTPSESRSHRVHARTLTEA